MVNHGIIYTKDREMEPSIILKVIQLEFSAIVMMLSIESITFLKLKLTAFLIKPRMSIFGVSSKLSIFVLSSLNLL